MKQTVGALSGLKSRNWAILAVGFGLAAWAGSPGMTLAAQEPAVPQAATSPAASTTVADAGKDANQSSVQDASRSKLDKPDDADPLKRPLSDKQKIKRQRELHRELSDTYKTWLDQDVVWIISDE